MEKQTPIAVAITVYDRVKHFKQCLQALSSCVGADQADVYIFLDISTSKHRWHITEQIELLSKKMTGFSSLSVLRSSVNLGASGNSQRLLSYMRKFEKFLVLEDDVIVHPKFLDVMNRLFVCAKNNTAITSVGAFSIETNNNTRSIYLSSYFNGYGCGFWSDSPLLDYLLTVHDPYDEMVREGLQKKIFKRHKNLKRSLKKIDVESKLNDIQATFYHIKNDMYQLRTALPYVANIGFDGTGANCGVRDYGNVNNMLQDDHVFFISDKEITYDIDFDRRYFQHFHPKLNWVKIFKKLLT